MNARHLIQVLMWYPLPPPVPPPPKPFDWSAEGCFDDRLAQRAVIRQLLANAEADDEQRRNDPRFHAGRVAGIRAAFDALD